MKNGRCIRWLIGLLIAGSRGDLYPQPCSSTHFLRSINSQLPVRQLLKEKISTTLIEENPKREGEYPSSSAADSNFTLIGEWVAGPCNAVAATGNYAYMGNGKRLQVLDITNPSDPKEVSDLITPGIISEMKVRDSLLFALSGGLQIFNISDPAHPSLMSYIPFSAASKMSVSDSFAYVLRYSGSVAIFDITDPSNPVFRSSISSGDDNAQAIARYGRWLYVGLESWPASVVIDVRDPDRPDWNGFIYGSPSDAVVVDTVLYMGFVDGIIAHSVAKPDTPIMLGYVLVDTGIYNNASIAVEGDYAYLSRSKGTIFTIEVSNPSVPKLVGVDSTNGYPAEYPWSACVENGLLFASFGTSLFIGDIASFPSLRQLVVIPAGDDGPLDVVLKGQYAIVAIGGAIAVLDISDPSHLRFQSPIVLTHGAIRIILNGNILYVASGNFVSIVDISDPLAPGTLSTINVGSGISDMCISGDKLYLIGIKLTVYDISRLDVPQKLGSADIAGEGIEVRGALAYCSGYSTGFTILDVSDPTQLGLLSRISYTTRDVVVRDSLAYLSTISGLVILDVTDPARPVEMGRDSLQGLYAYTYSYIALEDRTAYISRGADLYSIDISDPHHPTTSGAVSFTWGARFRVKNGVVYFCAGPISLKILKNDLVDSVVPGTGLAPKFFDLLQNYPNPFNGKTTIRIVAPHPGWAEVRIFNSVGEDCGKFYDGFVESGVNMLSFEMTRYPSGVYFYRLTTETAILVKKMVIIK